MPTRPRKPTDLPEPEGPGIDEEEPIEILEVVGVDETTGVEKEPPKKAGVHRRRASDDGPDQEVLRQELAEALREKDKYYDLLLRKQAEFDNFRKRMERDRDESGAAGARDVLTKLLPVLDNMERALRASEGSKDPLLKGIELVHQQFIDLLKKQGVQSIEALGTKFNPHLHEAVEVLEVPGFEPEIVLEEMQRGYTFNDRLLRPALVKVSSGHGTKRDPAGEGEPEDQGAGEDS